MAVSITSGLQGQSDLALGNIVGSNILNILLVLGISAVITPLVVSQRLVQVDVPILILAALVLLGMAVDGRISNIDGLILTAGILVYTVYAILGSRKEQKDVREEYEKTFADGAEKTSGAMVSQILFVIAGLAMMTLGASWLVNGAEMMARWLGMSELIIGLTVVALGTSLPEVATSIVAAFRGERDIAVGNAIGSSIFNILAAAGLASLVLPGGLEAAATLVRFDIPIMIAVFLACLPIFTSGHLIARWEGALFLVYYALYLFYLIASATSHPTLPYFSLAMLGFVVPITVITLAVMWSRLREKAKMSSGGA